MSLIYTTPASAASAGSSKKRHSIYIGGKKDAKDRNKLERWGVTHILNMTPPKDSSLQTGVPNYFETKRKFQYKRIPVFDAPTTNLLSHAPVIVSFITKALNYGSILVHCQRGVSRSSTAVMFYLMNVRGMKMECAMDVCRGRRGVVNPIPAFMGQLKEYELICRNDNDNYNENEEHGSSISEKNMNASASASEGGNIGVKVNATKKRKVMGPIGPSWDRDTRTAQRANIGPSRPPSTSIGPSRPPSTSIGPSLPPAMTIAIDDSKGDDHSDTNTFRTETADLIVAPEEQSEQTEIGPCLPPSKSAESGSGSGSGSALKGDENEERVSR